MPESARGGRGHWGGKELGWEGAWEDTRRQTSGKNKTEGMVQKQEGTEYAGEGSSDTGTQEHRHRGREEQRQTGRQTQVDMVQRVYLKGCLKRNSARNVPVFAFFAFFVTDVGDVEGAVPNR